MNDHVPGIIDLPDEGVVLLPKRHLESAVVGPSAEKALRCLLQNQESGVTCN